MRLLAAIACCIVLSVALAVIAQNMGTRMLHALGSLLGA